MPIEEYGETRNYEGKEIYISGKQPDSDHQSSSVPEHENISSDSLLDSGYLQLWLN